MWLIAPDHTGTPPGTRMPGRASMEMIMAIYESQRRGTAPVQLPLPSGRSPLAALAHEQGWDQQSATPTTAHS
jgi:hypothetical protein